MGLIFARLLVIGQGVALGLSALPGIAHAEAPHQPPAESAQKAHSVAAEPDLSQTVPPHPLPPPSVTHHTLDLPDGRTLHFKATAEAVRLSDAQSGAPLADIAVTAFQLEGSEGPSRRALTVAMNGGPGASSAWLDFGAVGPWRLPVDASDISPAMSPQVVDNADTWLDVTDLLFIDPLNTGYSRTLGKEDVEKRFFSVDGDIGSLATVIRKWLVANDRLASPKYILGESYGGFRAPKIARKLEDDDGIGVNGVVMLSPVLDFGWFASDDNPAVQAAHLPSLVAAAKHLGGANPRSQLQAVESYAAGPYLVDLFRGRRDPEAIRRMSGVVAGFTGLDPAFVQRLGGRVDTSTMTRETNRNAGRIASNYDTNVTGYDPHPFAATSHHDDPILDGLKTPMAEAAAEVTAERLKWPVQARYEILNMQVNGHWDWDGGLRPPEAMGDLTRLLSLDPHFRALVIHGVTDQVTPYFASKMLIDQLPAFGDPSRISLAVLGGGHMPYLEDASRAAMHEAARKLILGDAATPAATKPAGPPR